MIVLADGKHDDVYLGVSHCFDGYGCLQKTCNQLSEALVIFWNAKSYLPKK